MAKMIVAFARETMLRAALGDRISEQQDARMVSNGTLAEIAARYEREIEKFTLDPQALLEMAEHWSQDADEALERALLVEPIAPGYGTTRELLDLRQ